MMTSPENNRVQEPIDDGGSASAGTRRRTLAIAVAFVVLVGVVVAGVAVARSSASASATATAATATSAPVTAMATSKPNAGTTAPTAVCASASVTSPATTTDQNTGKLIPPAMSSEQDTKTRAELTALAARLPAQLTLTAPATWAQYAGQTPDYDQDIVSCPHIADRLAADLGARWTYSFGKLPTGPFGCYWTPVPWIPDRPPAERFFVSIGYETGTVPVLLQGMDYCMGGVEGPHVDAPAVRQGAVLYGCDDAGGPRYDLAVPDAGGTGVFFLHATGGAQQPPPQVEAAMLAVIDSATRSYR
jgi:hypothetical protein